MKPKAVRLLLTCGLVVVVSASAAARAATPEEQAQLLAELRVRYQALSQQILQLDGEVQRSGEELTATAAELDRALAARAAALSRLGDAERRLHAVRGSLDEAVRQLYVRGRTGTLVAALRNPMEMEVATQYLATLAANEFATVDALHAARDEVATLRALTERGSSAVAERYAVVEQTHRGLLAARDGAGVELRLLKERIGRLAATWAEYRLSLAEDLITEKAAAGKVAKVTREQARRRASLPLGPTVGVPPRLRATARELRGVASWYGPGFHGRVTASGALYDQRDFTVAHKTLPLGTLLLVSHGERQVVVYVNDRGPYIPGREFELSQAAASYLGVGLGNVTATILEEPP